MHKLLRREKSPEQRNSEIQNKISREVCILINLNLGVHGESLKRKPEGS